MSKYVKYENEKQKLKYANLSVAEYEQALKELARKLKI